MTLYEVVLKLAHDTQYADTTKRFPSAKMFIWCNREHDVLEVVVGNPKEYRPVMKQIRAIGIGGVVEESSDRHRAHILISQCSCMNRDTIIKHIGELDLLHVFPTVIAQGWEYHRIIAFRHEDLKKLQQRLERQGWGFEILRKVPFDGFIASSLTLTADALFSDLTEKQIDALLTAHGMGYYKLPRRADVKTIAAKRRVPRTTFQEHLKKAENKLVTSLVPYIQQFRYASPEKRKSLVVA